MQSINSIIPIRYLWGDEIQKPIIPRFKSFPYMDMNLMLSAWEFRKLNRKYNKLKELGIRKILGLSDSDNRQIMIDSGGFKGYSINFDLPISTIIKIYEASNLKREDKTITLDKATLPFESPVIRKEKILKTTENYLKMKNLYDKTLGVVHGWTKKEQLLSLEPCETDSIIAFPSYFTLLTNNKKDSEGNTIKIIPHSSFEGMKSLKSYFYQYWKIHNPVISQISVQKLIVKRFLDFIDLYQERKLKSRVHVLGASAGLAMHILNWTTIFNQMDSANWRVKANHYKIMLSYEDISVAEAYMGKKKIKYGNTKWRELWDEPLLRCECPTCLGLSLTERKLKLGMKKTEGFDNRAVHNAYHYNSELTIAREKAGTKGYTNYINKRVNKSSGFYKMLWRVVKNHIKSKKYTTLDAFMKTQTTR